MIVPRRDVLPEDWDAFAFRHEGWIWWTSLWLDYELAWGRSEDRSFAVYHGARLAAIVPYLAIDGVPSYNGETGVMPLGQNWREMAALKGMVGTFRGHPVPTPTAQGWPTRVIDTAQPVEVLRHDLRHSNRALINRAAERYDLVTGPLAGQMLHDLYSQQAHTLPVIPEAAWQVLWRLVEKGWLHFYAAVDHGGRCDGAIGVLAHGDWSYYSAGRSAVSGVNSFLLWRVMTHPVARYFEVGWEARPWDDDKAKAIAFHKASMGGSLWHVPTWRL